MATQTRERVELISPSKVLNDWLTESGVKVMPEGTKGRTKWHFCYQDADGFSHVGFAERSGHERLGGVIEVDKRYRPFNGFPNRDGMMTKHYLHVVFNKSMTEFAVMTPWSFLNCDSERPDDWDESKGAMVFRVPPESYSVFFVDTPSDGGLVNMCEVNDER